MYLQYFVGIKNRDELVIVSPIPIHGSSMEDSEYAKYKKENIQRLIRDAITDGRSFQIADWIFNPEAIDYVIVSIVEE